jgi:hypothetical protein
MNAARVLELLDALPPGISEMYFHPATAPWAGIDPQIADYDFAGELDALVSPDVRAKLTAIGIDPRAYSDLRAC